MPLAFTASPDVLGNSCLIPLCNCAFGTKASGLALPAWTCITVFLALMQKTIRACEYYHRHGTLKQVSAPYSSSLFQPSWQHKLTVTKQPDQCKSVPLLWPLQPLRQRCALVRDCMRNLVLGVYLYLFSGKHADVTMTQFSSLYLFLSFLLFLSHHLIATLSKKHSHIWVVLAEPYKNKSRNRDTKWATTKESQRNRSLQ